MGYYFIEKKIYQLKTNRVMSNMETPMEMKIANCVLEDMFDVLMGNNEYITDVEFRERYGEVEYNGLDGGADTPNITMIIEGEEYVITMQKK